jgi:anaerobic selenocysteine-containing dehydrogenase
MGGNAAEAHPCGFKWVIEAKIENGAKLVVVDPRFTRTAAVADYYAPIRPGTDIAFLNGVIHYPISPSSTASSITCWRRTRSSTSTCAPTPMPA